MGRTPGATASRKALGMRLYKLLPALLLALPAARGANPLHLSPEVTLGRPLDTTVHRPPGRNDNQNPPSLVTLRWHADSDGPGQVEYWTNGGARRTVSATGRAGDYHAAIGDLPANTEFHYILSPYGDKTESREHRYYTRPPKGTLETQTLPMLAVVFTPLHTAGQTGPGTSTRVLSDEEIARIRTQLEDVRDFYFRHTHGKLNLVWDLETVNRDVGNKPSLDSFGDVQPEAEKEMGAVLARKGKSEGDYAGAIFLFGWSEGNTPEEKAKVYRGQAFSGGTYGTDAPWAYKRTPFSLINFNHEADIRWTVTHEFGHQLDAMADYSGFPSLPFNHPDPSNLGGVYGEHWDVNAFLLSHFPKDKWIGLKFGHRSLSKDADEDGLADDDPALPLDEKRFGSDRRRADTDGDDLSDLDEYTVPLGVSHGLNEEMAEGVFHAPDPRKKDSDGDGLEDGPDPYPEYGVNTVRPMRTPDLDGRIGEGEWAELGAIRTDATGPVTYGLQWDARYLYVAMHAGKPLELALDLDGADDGWFAGKDNYRLAIAPPPAGSPEPVVSSVVWDWSVFDDAKDPNPYLSQTKDLVPASDILAAAGPDAGGYTVEVAIPYSYKTDLRLYAGKRIGIRPGVRRPGEKYQYTMFEPHRLVTVTLTDKENTR